MLIIRENKMRRDNGKNLWLKILLGLVIIGIIIFIIINIVKNREIKGNTSKNVETEVNQQQEEENKVEEEFVQHTEDGTKVNVGSKITDDREVDGLKFTNIQLTEKNNQSTLLADVENATGKNISVSFKPDHGAEGKLSKETLLGKIKLHGNEVFVCRENLVSLSEQNLDDIVDEKIKQKVKDYVSKHNGEKIDSILTAFSQETSESRFRVLRRDSSAHYGISL